MKIRFEGLLEERWTGAVDGRPFSVYNPASD
jgi:hypothetical protein